ncbi:hypothetical protein WDU94_000203 [Cyamophila willieti]
MLTPYSPNDVIQFLCEEVLTQRNKGQISANTLWKLFILSLFSVSLHRHLLPASLESFFSSTTRLSTTLGSD